MSKVKTAEPEGFPEFWQVWSPHRRHTDGRGDARNTYRKHILMGALPEDIIDGAKGFFRFMAEKDKPYVPLAASWLNKEAYSDWCEQERAYHRRLAEREQTNVVQMTRAALPDNHFSKRWEAMQAAKKEAM